MSQLFVLTEEPSIVPVVEAVFKLTQAALGLSEADVHLVVIPHEGKQDLKRNLKKTVPTLAKQPNTRVLVLHDQDNDDCRTLKKSLMDEISAVDCPYKIRIVCRDLECWLWGDEAAVARAFPRYKIGMAKLPPNTDDLQFAFKRFVDKVPELKKNPKYSKRKLAKCISPFLDVQQNKSLSFGYFVAGLRGLMMASE